MISKKYIVIVQCHIVMERCSGYFCEKSYNSRTGGFSDYPKDKNFRTLYLTCGGCCGRAIHRKLGNLLTKIDKKEGLVFFMKVITKISANKKIQVTPKNGVPD